MINVFLPFNKYKVKHIVVINGSFWGKSGARLNKIIFSTKPSGSVWATFTSQIIIFIIIITLIVS